MSMQSFLNLETPIAVEGVIKYQCQHATKLVTIPAKAYAQLQSWRSLLFSLGLIGQDVKRYDGLSYGNISLRKTWGMEQFWITGTQTSHLSALADSDYCLVNRAQLAENILFSEGLSRPSSEALTHAAVYQANAQVRAVLHVHSPVLWQKTEELQLVHTAEYLAYGTPTMAQAVATMFRQGVLAEQGIFTMLGHEDGVVAFADSLENAGLILIKVLSRALAIDSRWTSR